MELLAPDKSGIVYASAGTGKTWLLISRLLRLLLAGKQPDSILAITFTNKAANEMQARLSERLLQWRRADDEELAASLNEIGIENAASYFEKARALYGQMLYTVRPIDITTFHAFCQKIISLCPLQSGVPLNFSITERADQLQDEAIEQLFRTTTQRDKKLSAALDLLFEQANSLTIVRAMLKAFFKRQNDWYCYISEQSDAADYAAQLLYGQLAIDEKLCPDETWKMLRSSVTIYKDLLSRHPTKMNSECAAQLSRLLTLEHLSDTDWRQLDQCFHTQEGEIRQRAVTGALEKALGPSSSEKLIALAQTISDAIVRLSENEKRRNNYQLNQAWYVVGAELLKLYSAIKKQHSLLDFDDLERMAGKLLDSNSYGSEWLQYRLATKIEHILVDEFQDTNPSQWQLLEPLMAEIAAQQAGSVFIVGDRKQSIYAFRRAEPDLQLKAGEWIKTHLAGNEATINASYRSAPEIINFVNQMFDVEAIPLFDFELHQTNLDTRGGVYLFDLFEPTAQTPSEAWRNPLTSPFQSGSESSRESEAVQIAKTIQHLRHSDLEIVEGDQSRPLLYQDILILARQKTHFDVFARALRRHQIPVLSTYGVGLLSNLEVKDMLQLLSVLLNPYDDLALAQILSSPIYSLDEAQLVELSQAQGQSWFEKLRQLSHHGSELWHGIYQSLNGWIEKSDNIPLHDLLSQIFNQQDIIQRYRDSVHPQEADQVQANLQSLLEYTLDYDSGRYPHLSRFLESAEALQQAEEGLETVPPREQDCVSLMSIHSAKGLEAAVVFLVDCAFRLPNKETHQVIVDWPSEEQKPKHFVLLPPIAERSTLLQKLTQARQERNQKEEINLLYVALTRAKQYLFISGSGRDSQYQHWYNLIKRHYREQRSFAKTITQSTPHKRPAEPQASIEKTSDLFTETPLLPTPIQQLSPSLLLPTDYSQKSDVEQRTQAFAHGSAVHQALQMLNEQAFTNLEQFKQALAQSLPLSDGDSEHLAATSAAEAWQLFSNPHLKALFDDNNYLETFNEMPILYQNSDKQLVYGKLDRVCVAKDSVWIVDYKSNRAPSNEQDAQDYYQKLASRYAPQMHCYRVGMQKLYAHKKLRTSLLFTQHGFLYDYPSQIT